MALQIALNHLSEEHPPLKAAQIAFIGPVTEQVSFEVETLRQGKSATQVAVDASIPKHLSVPTFLKTLIYV